MPAYRPIAERFSEKYAIDPATGCWNWQGSVSRGYPYIGGERNSGPRLAHKFAYEHFIGPVPEGRIVRHSCHNSICVNPHHLIVGTHADNMLDMAKAGRRIGRNTGSAFSGKQIARLRKLLSRGMTQQEAADALGVHRSTVQRAGYRGELVVERDQDAPRRRVFLSEAEREKVLADLRSGETISALARKYSTDRKTIRNIRDKMI